MSRMESVATQQEQLVETMRERVNRDTLTVLTAITDITERQARTKAVQSAIARIGMSAEPNNMGALVKEVSEGRQGLLWCAYFLMHCWKEAGVTIPKGLYDTLHTKPFRQTLEAFRQSGLVELKRPDYSPQPGDIAVFAPSELDDPTPLAGHVSMVLYPYKDREGKRDGIYLLEPNVRGTDVRLGIPSDRTGIETRAMSERDLQLRRLYAFAVPRL